MAPLTRSTFAHAMQKAAKQQFPSDTPAQAYAKFLETDEGKANYDAYLKMEEDDCAPATTLTKAASHFSKSNQAILKKADALFQVGQAQSKEEAVSLVLQREPGLYDQYLEENH